jgi:hypothetical protein
MVVAVLRVIVEISGKIVEIPFTHSPTSATSSSEPIPFQVFYNSTEIKVMAFDFHSGSESGNKLPLCGSPVCPQATH